MTKVDDQSLVRDRIIFFMEKKNLSENQLAKKSNLRQSTVNKIVGQGSIPRVDTLHSICNGLNISMHEFFDFEPYKGKENNEMEKLKEEILIELKEEILTELKEEIKKEQLKN